MSRDQCAVVVNPTKLDDEGAALVRSRLAEAGYDDPLWLETAEDDPGRAMTRQAVDAGVGLVLAAGGDGTVRLVGAGLANTGIALGIVPVGTGNLLARNLHLPLDLAEALEVALGGEERNIDTVVLTADGGERDRFMVMAGTGFDAMIMEDVDTKLKKFIGPGAYFVAAGKAAGRLPVAMQITVDGTRHRRTAIIALMGSCGRLTGELELIPDAHPDDGLVHVYVAYPTKVRHLLKALARLITRRPRKDDHVAVWSGSTIEVRLAHADTYEVDGDVEGEATVLRAKIDPGSLRVRARPPHHEPGPSPKES